MPVKLSCVNAERKNIFRAFYHPQDFFFTTRKNPAGRPTSTTLNGRHNGRRPQNTPTRYLPRYLLVKNRGKEQPDTYLAPFLHYLQIVKST